MPTPQKFAISAMQAVRLSAHDEKVRRLEAQLAIANELRNEALTTIVAGHVTPADYSDWTISFAGTELVLTPPAELPPMLKRMTLQDRPE